MWSAKKKFSLKKVQKRNKKENQVGNIFNKYDGDLV